MKIKIDTKINNKIGVITFIFITDFCGNNFTQSKISNSTEHAEQKRKLMRRIKKLAFCKCLQNGYYNDSALQKVPSAFIISDIEIGNFGYLDSTNSLAKSFIDNIPANLLEQVRGFS